MKSCLKKKKIPDLIVKNEFRALLRFNRGRSWDQQRKNGIYRQNKRVLNYTWNCMQARGVCQDRRRGLYFSQLFILWIWYSNWDWLHCHTKVRDILEVNPVGFKKKILVLRIALRSFSSYCKDLFSTLLYIQTFIRKNNCESEGGMREIETRKDREITHI